MNPAEGANANDGEAPSAARVFSRGGRARGRGRTAANSAFVPVRVERDVDEYSEAGTIDRFLREEELGSVTDTMSLLGRGLDTTASSLYADSLAPGEEGEAYQPSLSEGRHSGSGLSSGDPLSGSDSGSTISKKQADLPIRTLPSGFNKQGTTGHPLNLETNYYRMNETAGFKLFQYQVDFVPMEDDTSIKKTLLRQHEAELGNYIFDGSMMRKTNIIPQNLTSLTSIYGAGNIKYTITLRLVGDIQPHDNNYLQFFNIVMRKTNEMLGMEEMGRNFFDPEAAHDFPEHKLSLWPGFQTAIRNHESGTLLCVEVTHKVLRTASVYETIISLGTRNRMEMEKQIRSMFVDSIVITHYNKKTYKISDVDFKVTPASSFRGQDGSTTTYAEYYAKRYGINIDAKDMCQPMLVSLPRKKDVNKGVTGNIYLCSSLCHPTGLTDDMRKNFSLMKSLSKHLHMNPEERRKALVNYMDRILGNPMVQKEFSNWGISFNPTPVDTVGRVLPKERINIGGDMIVDSDPKGDWGKSLGRGRHMLQPVNINKWVVFTPPMDREKANNFVRVMKIIGAELGTQVNAPLEMITYEIASVNERTIWSSVKKFLDDGVKLDLVFFVLPNNQLRRYVEVKHYFTLKLGVPTQCCLAKTLMNSNLNAIASKIIMQVTAKLGGVPWSIKVPPKKMMVLGFDVYHCSDRKGESAGALVATLDPALTQYTSVVSFHKDKSELSSKLCLDMSECLLKFHQTNNFLPDRLVFFRDGVGEGQISFVKDHEVEQVKLALRDVYRDSGVELPKLTFIVVTKKINTRAFLRTSHGVATNLPVGTVMDRDVTLPERYDFFMVSQDVRQGTVSPSNYHVVHDESGWNADKVQMLSYKMTHLYYNWSGTVAVPAVCQYAHKLAYLTGVALNEKAHKTLQNKLWYL